MFPVACDIWSDRYGQTKSEIGHPVLSMSIRQVWGVVTKNVTHGGWAKGIPKNLETRPDLVPMKVASSRCTVGGELVTEDRCQVLAVAEPRNSRIPGKCMAGGDGR